MVATYRVNGDDVLIPSLVPLQDLPWYHVEKPRTVDVQVTELTLVPTFVWSLDAPRTAKWGEDMKVALVSVKGMIVSRTLDVGSAQRVGGLLQSTRWALDLNMRAAQVRERQIRPRRHA